MVFCSSGSVSRVRSQCSGTISTSPTPTPPTAASRKSPMPCRPAHALADRRRQRHPVDGDRGGVVEQRLALEDGHDPVRQAHLAGDRGGRDRVRRRDDRAQHQRRGQRQPGHDRVGDRADGHRREQHVPDRQQRHRAQVGTQAQVGAVQRGGVQQGREHEGQHPVRVEPVARGPPAGSRPRVLPGRSSSGAEAPIRRARPATAALPATRSSTPAPPIAPPMPSAPAPVRTAWPVHAQSGLTWTS